LEFFIRLVAWCVLFPIGYRFSKKDIKLPDVSPWVILAGMTALYAMIYFLWSWNRNASFNAYAFDLSVYMQALSNFQLQSGIFEKSLLAGHFSPLLIVLVPLIKAVPSPALLFLIQAVLLALPAIPLYRVSRKLGASAWAALLVVFVYLNFFSTRTLAYSDFHVEDFMPLLFLLLFDAYLSRANGIYWLLLVVALGVKEDVGFYLSAASVILAVFQRDRWRLNMATAVVALLAGLASLMYVMQSNHGAYPYFDLWSAYGRGLLGILLGVLVHPFSTLALCLKPAGLRLIFSLALLPALSIWGLAGLPCLLLQLASNLELQSNLGLYYVAPVLPFAFIGMAAGWVRVERWLASASPERGRKVLLGLAFFLLIFNFTWMSWNEVTPEHNAIHRLVQKVSPGASVLAQADLAPHVPQQARVLVLGVNAFEDPDVVIFHVTGNIWPYTRETYLHSLNALRMNPDYYVWKEDQGVVIFTKRKK
jgi:uncharacterized membrane protein